jgi:hypothetical protein
MTTRKIITIVTALSLWVTLMPQQAEAVGLNINAQAVVIPIKDSRLGAMLGVNVDLLVIVATFRSGYLLPTFVTDAPDTSIIPILAGLRYRFPLPVGAVFLGVEGGTYKGGSEWNIGINSYIGADIGPVEFTAGFNVMNLEQFDESKTIMLTLGYNFFSLP